MVLWEIIERNNFCGKLVCEWMIFSTNFVFPASKSLKVVDFHAKIR